MLLDLSRLNQGLLSSASPLMIVSIKELVSGDAGTAIAFIFSLVRQPTQQIQTNLNIWTLANGRKRVKVCVATMFKGCYYDCGLCEGVLGGKVLLPEEITQQVKNCLLSSYVNIEDVDEVEIDTFGIGEPFVGLSVIKSFEALSQLLVGALFTFSTHGPRCLRPAFNALVKLAASGVRIRLQLSIDILSDAERFLYMDRKDPKGLKSINLEQLGALGQEWMALGFELVVNFVVAPTMPRWNQTDVNKVQLWFPSPAVIKLSYESYTSGGSQDQTTAYDELEARRNLLTAIGRPPEVFFLPGTWVPGGGCGSGAVIQIQVKF